MACDGTRVQLVTIDVVSVMIGDMEEIGRASCRARV